MINRLTLGFVNKGTRIEKRYVAVRNLFGDPVTALIQKPKHQLAIHQGLGASQRKHAYRNAVSGRSGLELKHRKLLGHTRSPTLETSRDENNLGYTF